MRVFGILISMLALFIACNTGQENIDPVELKFSSNNQYSECVVSNGWSIPINEILGNKLANKGVPAINNPKFTTVEKSNGFMHPDELVIVIKKGNALKIYPHRILDYHEVVNDWLDGDPIALTFCPLAGTSMCWDRTINNEVVEFAASGLLFNANLITYDLKTSSRWSQILGKSINGSQICQNLDFITLLETNWGMASTLYPQALVLDDLTGYNFNYDQTPISFNNPVDTRPVIEAGKEDLRLPSFERVHIVEINGQQKAYRFTEFTHGPNLVIDKIGETNFLVLGDEQSQYFVSFKINKNIDYQLMGEGRNEQVILDSKGNIINYFGEIIEGPDVGTKLESLQSYTGYWYSVSSFTGQLEIYSGFELGG